MISLFEGVSFRSDLGNGITNEKLIRIREKCQELYGAKGDLCVKDWDGSSNYSFHVSINGFRMEWTEKLHNEMAYFIMEEIGAHEVSINEQQGLVDISIINDNGKYRDSIKKKISRS